VGLVDVARESLGEKSLQLELDRGDRAGVEQLAQVLAAERAITADTALRLGRYFRVNPQFWLNLQSTYDLRAAAREHQAQIERDVQPRAE